MSEKSKLYVFEKKEVALIFVFMLLIAVTSFMLGVKIGKSYSFQTSGLTQEDREKVELLSTQEENVNKVIEEEKSGADGRLENQLREEMHQKLENRVRENIESNKGSVDMEEPQTEPAPDQSSTSPQKQEQDPKESEVADAFDTPSQKKKLLKTKQKPLKVSTRFN